MSKTCQNTGKVHDVRPNVLKIKRIALEVSSYLKKLKKKCYSPAKYYLYFPAEHYSEEFTAINRMQRVPVIDHNGFILTERYVNIQNMYYFCFIILNKYLCR